MYGQGTVRVLVVLLVAGRRQQEEAGRQAGRERRERTDPKIEGGLIF